jgi:DNA-binding NtrC family response regulator
MIKPGEPAAPVILVVEDDALVRMVVSDTLADAGYRVIDAVTADEALRLLNMRSDVRVVITDVRMPGKLDGFALARIVAERWPEVGLLVSSGDTWPAPGDLPPRARYVPKPCPPSALMTAVRTLLDETSASTDEVSVVGAAPVLPVSEVTKAAGQAAFGGGLAQPLPQADE